MDEHLSKIILALLDWPFLLFVALVLFIVFYRSSIGGLLGRGDIQISWGDNRNIKLKDISRSLDEDLEPILDDLRDLREKLAALEKAGASLETDVTPAAPSESAPSPDADRLKQSLVKNLSDPRYRWRTTERLAALAGVGEVEVLDALNASGEFVVSISKKGRRIARLASR